MFFVVPLAFRVFSLCSLIPLVFLLQPFSTQLLFLPSLDFNIPLQLPPGLSLSEDMIVPMHSLRWLLDDYVRNARQKVQVALYQVELQLSEALNARAAVLHLVLSFQIHIVVSTTA